MFGSIIVATDLQASTRASLAVACDLLHSEGQILLVHVIRPLLHLPDAEKGPVYERLKAAAGLRMLELSTGFTRERGVEVLCLTEIGSPGRRLAAIAGERQVDLIVLAHDPVDDPATLGSVSFQVAHLSPCSVLVLKAQGAARPATVPSGPASRAVPAPKKRTATARRAAAR